MNALNIMVLLNELKPDDLVDAEFRSSSFGKDLTIIVHGKFRLHVNDVGFCAFRLESGKYPEKGNVVGLYPLVVEWAKKRIEGF